MQRIKGNTYTHRQVPNEIIFSYLFSSQIPFTFSGVGKGFIFLPFCSQYFYLLLSFLFRSYFFNCSCYFVRLYFYHVSIPIQLFLIYFFYYQFLFYYFVIFLISSFYFHFYFNFLVRNAHAYLSWTCCREAMRTKHFIYDA